MNIFVVEYFHELFLQKTILKSLCFISIKCSREKFQCDVGYSGHEVDSYICCIVARTLGATSIERHISLGRSMYGSDQAASLEPAGLRHLVGSVRKIELAMGDGIKRIIGKK